MNHPTPTQSSRSKKPGRSQSPLLYRRDGLFKAVATLPPVYMRLLTKYLPQRLLDKLKGTIHPVELGKIPEAQLDDGTACGVLEILLRHRRGTRVLPTLERLTPTLTRIKSEPNGAELMEAIISYCFLASLEDERENVVNYVGEHVGNHEQEIAMTVATALKREGRQEGLLRGRQEGREEAAVGMLKEGLTLETVRKITHLSKERITQLLAKLKHAATRKRR